MPAQMSKSKSYSSLPQAQKAHQAFKSGIPTVGKVNDISRKAIQSTDGREQKAQKQAPSLKNKKIKLWDMMPGSIQDLNKAAKADQEERENLRLAIERQQNQLELPTESETVLSIQETLSRVNQKLASAQAKMHFGFGKKKDSESTVSTFNLPPQAFNKHNSDALLNTGDISDIKNTKKTLFEHTDSTALMSGKQGSTASGRPSVLQLTTPGDTYKASQFTLETKNPEKTPVQFKADTVVAGGKRDAQMQETDDQGNRMSILPSKERPRVPSTRKREASAKAAKSPYVEDFEGGEFQEEKEEEVKAPKKKTAPVKAKSLKTVKAKIDTKLPASKSLKKAAEPQMRQNFVRINQKQNYKPHLRGAAFTNKIMAKKRNFVRFNDKMKKRLQIEQAKARDQVNAYGGLGKVGLDHEGGLAQKLNPDGTPCEEDLVPGFSASALKFARKVKAMTPSEFKSDKESEEDEDLLGSDMEGLDKLKQIDEELKEEEEPEVEVESHGDKAMYKIPATDEGYLAVLKERFNHESFKPGQLEAIKILLEKQENTLVVLATGGGKSLVYQFTSLFLDGLVLVVTPLISLMTDQLGKLPDFIPGASLNSQQPYSLKKQIIQAIQDKNIKVLFISPEKFFIEDFSKYGRKVAMVCVDEIHCSSEWSHNFRPAYLKLHDMIKEKIATQNSSCVVLGLTATATKATQKSVCRIFNIKHPEHRVTEPNLARMNLSLSITRDLDKLKALLALLASQSFKKLTSILIFATHKATCERLASHLNQNGINSAAYHAGKTDQQRQMIQKNFINNNIRVLVCTIAFSMGIDKSDIQSVIHYDMPKSIENYVQEIGRAGRDGKLARCHLFLNNEDFFLIRRLILTDILDQQNSLRLTNKIIVEFKKNLLRLTHPQVSQNKKRKLKNISKEEDEPQVEQLIEDFEHEELFKSFYEKCPVDNSLKIFPSELEQVTNPDKLYIFLNVKDTTQMLDLKREVVLTMLNSLEHLPEHKRFMKLEGCLPDKVGIRFHSKRPEEFSDPFIVSFMKIAKESQGVFNASVQRLAYELNISPFQIPKKLFQLQSSQNGISYDTDNECFVIKIVHIPTGGKTLELASDMLNETRRIEKNMIQKLNCMYFIARRVSLPSVEYMLKKEKQENGEEMYKDFSQQLNDLINLYFSIENEENMEVQVAGNEEERNVMMPLIYIDSHREKASVESDVKIVLKDFYDNNDSKAAQADANDRIKALDVVKVLMGIYSDRLNVKRFMNNGRVWAKLQEYDYEDVMKVAQSTVNQYHLEAITGVKQDPNIVEGNASKMRRLNP